MAGSLALEEMKKMGKRAEHMSALDVALMGRMMASEDDTESLTVDREDEDWNRVVSAVKSGGPKSWFAKKVDFTFHEAHFLGRVGYSVRGGVVPLFDGAAIDLSAAELEAEDPKKAEPDARMGNPAGNKNWIVGHGGLLVLAPIGTDHVVPVVTGQVIVTEKGLVTEAEKPLRFQRGDESVRANRLELSDQIAVLYGIQVEKGGEDLSGRYRTEAVLTGKGLELIPDVQQKAPETEEIQETPVNQAIENVNNVITDIAALAAPDAAVHLGDENKNVTVDFSASSIAFDVNSEETSLDEEEDPCGQRL